MRASVVDLRYKMNEVLKALVSSNAKHFKPVKGLKLKVFKP